MENNYLVNIKNKTNINIGELESFFLNKYGELSKKWFKTLEIQTNQTPKKTHVCFGPSLLFLGASKRQFKRLCMCVAHKDAKKFAIFLCIWKQKFLSFFFFFFDNQCKYLYFCDMEEFFDLKYRSRLSLYAVYVSFFYFFRW